MGSNSPATSEVKRQMEMALKYTSRSSQWILGKKGEKKKNSSLKEWLEQESAAQRADEVTISGSVQEVTECGTWGYLLGVIMVVLG